MKTPILIRDIEIQAANAVSGLLYGFPAITHFLGFCEALSRRSRAKIGLGFSGLGVVCHDYYIHEHTTSKYGDKSFALTRNPLGYDGKPQPFNEEGKVSARVSLILEGDFHQEDIDFGTGSEEDDLEKFSAWLGSTLVRMRLAGGTIVQIGSVKVLNSWNSKKEMFALLPGFVLFDRSEIIQEHQQSLEPESNLFDAWFDIFTLKYKCSKLDNAQANRENVKQQESSNSANQIHHVESEKTSYKWEQVPKKFGGWLVPIHLGYKGISSLYPAGEVAHTRDPHTAFRFVECAYGVGQWVSPHKLQSLKECIWRTKVEDDWYLCTQDR